MIIDLLYLSVSSFSNELSTVENDIYFKFFNSDKYSFLKKDGTVITNLKYELVGAFSEGLAAVSQDFRTGFINKFNQLAIPLKYDFVGVFSEGLVAVRIDRKWGFVDQNGDLMIPTIFDEVERFIGGLAKVSLNGKEGYIDRFGVRYWDEVSEPVYSLDDDLPF